jgi:hypothetical protein
MHLPYSIRVTLDGFDACYKNGNLQEEGCNTLRLILHPQISFAKSIAKISKLLNGNGDVSAKEIFRWRRGRENLLDFLQGVPDLESFWEKSIGDFGKVKREDEIVHVLAIKQGTKENCKLMREDGQLLDLYDADEIFHVASDVNMEERSNRSEGEEAI